MAGTEADEPRIDAAALRSGAPRPPSEVEWEELLMRLELTPRAVRAYLSDAGVRGGLAREPLQRLLLREAWAAKALEALRTGAAVEWSGWARLGEPDAERMSFDFAALRAKNFAQAQRRGLAVWEWRASAEGIGEFTAYQLLRYLMTEDGRSLAELRAALRTE